MLRETLCVLFGSLILLGCTSAIRLQPLSADHPANPEAPEAPVQAPPNTLSEGQTTPAATPESPEETVYSCPMHPEVKASAPGRCPECGMELLREGAE